MTKIHSKGNSNLFPRGRFLVGQLREYELWPIPKQEMARVRVFGADQKKSETLGTRLSPYTTVLKSKSILFSFNGLP